MPTTTQRDGGLLIPLAPPADTFAARLRQALVQFESQLKDTENFRIVATVGGKTYGVEHITVRGRELVVIDGPADEPNRYRIMCHVNALQLMLVVEPKEPSDKRRRIGFLWEEPDTGQSAASANGEPAVTPHTLE